MNRAMAGLRKILPNMLTLIRVVLTCLLNLYILAHFGSLTIPMVIFLLIYMTDFLDGKIARFYGNASYFGAVFDILADLLYIVASYIVLYSFHILPLWFLLIILLKFMEFVATSIFLKKFYIGKSIFIFDLIGRFAAAFFYFIPALAYVSFLLSRFLYFCTIHYFNYIITFIVFISSSYRLWNCVKVYLFTKKQPQQEPNLSGA